MQLNYVKTALTFWQGKGEGQNLLLQITEKKKKSTGFHQIKYFRGSTVIIPLCITYRPVTQK